MTVETERAKARAVREMFASIADKYDFVNHLLSANIDRRWRHISVREVAQRLSVRHPRILDIGCGTADFSLAFSKLGHVVGCDFCHPMIIRGKQKIERTRQSQRVELLDGDALFLPFSSSSFDAVVSAFALRNLANLDAGLTEMRRVLKKGGVLGILDFSMPRIPVLGELYRFYFMRILPTLGRIVSGVDGPYRYLPESVQTFPPPMEIKRLIARAGFGAIEDRSLTGGIATLFLATTEG